MSNPSSRFDLNATLILVIGAAGAIWLLVAVVAVQALTYNLMQSLHQRNVVAQPHEALRQHELDQVARISREYWIDQEEQIVAIPVDRAIRLYVQQLDEETPQ